VQTGAGAIAVEKLPLLASAVYKKCDVLDGVKDGLLDDPRKCGFDPAADLQMSGRWAAPSRFTSGAALKKIYGGKLGSAVVGTALEQR
jgi:feruloyl esterase